MDQSTGSAGGVAETSADSTQDTTVDPVSLCVCLLILKIWLFLVLNSHTRVHCTCTSRTLQSDCALPVLYEDLLLLASPFVDRVHQTNTC
mgnify:CR=1 FL=1